MGHDVLPSSIRASCWLDSSTRCACRRRRCVCVSSALCALLLPRPCACSRRRCACVCPSARVACVGSGWVGCAYHVESRDAGATTRQKPPNAGTDRSAAVSTRCCEVGRRQILQCQVHNTWASKPTGCRSLSVHPWPCLSLIPYPVPPPPPPPRLSLPAGLWFWLPPCRCAVVVVLGLVLVLAVWCWCWCLWC